MSLPVLRQVSAEELERARPASAADGLESQPGFAAAVAEAIGEPLHPLVVGDGEGRTVVLGRVSRRRPVHRLGYLRFRGLPIRSLDVVPGGIEPGTLDPATLLEALRAHGRTIGLDRIHVHGLPATSPLQAAARRAGAVVEARPSLHWSLALAGGFDGVLARHSARHRRRLRWEWRRLGDACRGDLHHEVVTTAEGGVPALERAEAIASRTYHAAVGGMIRNDAAWRAQVAWLAERGGLRLHFLVDAGGDAGGEGEDEGGAPRDIACLAAAHVGTTAHVLAMAFDPAFGSLSPGKHLLLRAIERACDEGLERVDFGVGDAEYKRVYGDVFHEERSVDLYARTLRGTGERLLHVGIAGLDRGLRRMLGPRLQRVVKRAWRRRATGARAVTTATDA